MSLRHLRKQLCQSAAASPWAMGLLWVLTISAFAACKNKDEGYLGSGSFETQELLVSAQSNGNLIRWEVEEGKAVKKGEMLGLIDTTQLHLQKESLIESKQSIQLSGPDIHKQTAALKRQIKELEKERQRTQNLLEAEVASRRQLDEVNTKLDVLRSQLAAQSSALQRNNASLEARGGAMETQIAQLSDQIQKSIVRSPIEGVVLENFIHQGELAVQGYPLLRLAKLDTLVLRAYVSGEDLPAIRLNETLSVEVDNGKGQMKTYQGRLQWIASKAEFTPKTVMSKQERDNMVYAVKVLVPNDGYLKIGMYGEIRKLNATRP